MDFVNSTGWLRGSLTPLRKGMEWEPLGCSMRQRLIALVAALLWLSTACGSNASQSPVFGGLSDAEFRQPLPEPRLHQVAHAPSAPSVFAKIATSSMQSSEFQIVGTEPTPRVQGQIGALVYHQAGVLAIGPPALELQPLDEYPGQNPDIDGRGDYVVIGSTVYQRGTTMSEWRLSSIGSADTTSLAYINPASWLTSSQERFLGESSINGSATWVVEATDAIGREFRIWIREADGYPLRYTTSYVNVKGRTYYINALYLRFNTDVSISPPSLSNHGIVGIGAPVQLPSGSVTVTNVSFDCSGTAIRQPTPKHKFVTIMLAFIDTGPNTMSISPYAWRLYGDGTNGAVPIDTGSPVSLRSQVVEPSGRVSGGVTFEVAEDAYQLITVGKLPDVTAVVSVFLPILPNGVSACP
jgi:hypothetical protein